MQQRQRYFLIVGGALGAFLCGGAVYASPYLTLYQMYQSVERKDIQGIASHVDFPALRTSVKTNMQEIVTKETSGQQNPLLNILGSVVNGFVLDPVVDTVVTPEGVAALLEGQRLQLGGNDKEAQFSEKAANVDVQAEYESFNQFAVSVKPKGEDTTPVTLLLSRDGLSWKVSGVRLPEIKSLSKSLGGVDGMTKSLGIEGISDALKPLF
jgi:Protein of unknown function (DUF2939)